MLSSQKFHCNDDTESVKTTTQPNKETLRVQLSHSISVPAVTLDGEFKWNGVTVPTEPEELLKMCSLQFNILRRQYFL